MRRVAVTGLGAITPIGNDAPSTWRAAVAGESGIDWIRSFDATGLPVRDAAAVLAGGGEACMHPLILAGFTAMRGLAVEEEHPPHASRPFDATRAGFVMGEGAAVLVLEELEAAQARGARIYAEVLGYGGSNDAHHMAQPEPEATGVADMMRAALRRANVEPEAGGYTHAP